MMVDVFGTPLEEGDVVKVINFRDRSLKKFSRLIQLRNEFSDYLDGDYAIIGDTRASRSDRINERIMNEFPSVSSIFGNNIVIPLSEVFGLGGRNKFYKKRDYVMNAFEVMKCTNDKILNKNLVRFLRNN